MICATAVLLILAIISGVRGGGMSLYSPGGAAQEADIRVNINTAGAAELDELDGIGPALAERIIEYRELNGGFSSVEELINVSGIGAVTYEKIRDDITVTELHTEE